MATYLHGPHFLLSDDKFHSFHILKSKIDLRAYLGSELTAACYRQLPRLCTPFTRSPRSPSACSAFACCFLIVPLPLDQFLMVLSAKQQDLTG